MLFLVRATIPVEAGNELVRDPNFGKRMEEVLAAIKPKTVYFAVEGGQRTIYLVVDGIESARIPAIVEPLWLSLKAHVDLIPAMSQAEFAKATRSIEQAAKKF
ncbi:MAG: hypothetical protein HY651_09820 [Acidobacteria bacterium]|nr:hypothetical protein [Acidobacteriota bacterium]